MKITAATFALLPALLQSSFKVNPANADEYDNGEEAAEGLKTALQKEKERVAEQGKKLAEYDTAKAAEIEAARKKALAEARTSGDFKAIEDDYKRQLKEAQDKATQAETARNAAIETDAINTAAGELAKMFVSPSLALPAIKARLKAELVEGKPLIRVLGKDGAASASSVEDLKKEFLTDADLKGSLVASKGSGGGSTQTPSGGGSTVGDDTKFDAANAKPADMIARLEAKGIGAGDDD